jgi:hypothetical protein
MNEGTAAISSTTPVKAGLLGNYPNPFNPATTIRYALNEDTFVSLKVYNMLGQEVATLVEGYQSAGYHSAEWNSRTEAGTVVASGIYMYRLTAGNVINTGRMLLAK